MRFWCLFWIRTPGSCHLFTRFGFQVPISARGENRNRSRERYLVHLLQNFRSPLIGWTADQHAAHLLTEILDAFRVKKVLSNLMPGL
jgi:hypothetical protein